jgi:multidrug efflux system membrane fusion protein
MSKGMTLSLAGLISILSLSACQKAGASPEKTAIPVNVQAVELETPEQGVRYTASIVPAAQVESSFRVAGYVTRVRTVVGVDRKRRAVEPGDFIEKGTELGQLRSDEYVAKVTEAESQLSEARSVLATAEAQLREAQAASRRAQEELVRATNLFDTESITKRDYEAAQTQQEVSEARVQAIESQIKAIQAKSGGARAMVQEAELARDDTTLIAPFSGTVVKRLVEVGSFVAPGRPAYVLADTRSLRAVFGIPDIDLPMVSVGTAVSLTADAVPGRTFQGHVISIAPAADPRTRVYDVEVALRNPANILRIGMICSLQLAPRTPTRTRLPLIPINSVIRSRRSPNGYAVYVVESSMGRQICRLREVALGDTYGNRIAVTHGLSGGERVVTAGSTIVQDGDRVQVVAR